MAAKFPELLNVLANIFWKMLLLDLKENKLVKYRIKAIFLQKLSSLRVCSSDKMTPIYFLHLSKVWSMLHHGSVWLVHKKMLLNTFMYFFGIFFVVSHQKNCVFIIFISFSDKVSNFYNGILSNQKRELVVSNYHQNCMVDIFCHWL